MWAKIDIKNIGFWPEGQKKGLGLGQSPPQDLEEGPRSGPHLLVRVKERVSTGGTGIMHAVSI